APLLQPNFGTVRHAEVLQENLELVAGSEIDGHDVACIGGGTFEALPVDTGDRRPSAAYRPLADDTLHALTQRVRISSFSHQCGHNMDLAITPALALARAQRPCAHQSTPTPGHERDGSVAGSQPVWPTAPRE